MLLKQAYLMSSTTLTLAQTQGWDGHVDWPSLRQGERGAHVGILLRL